MQSLKVTGAGQISLPATIRRRWNTDRVMLLDLGDHALLRPIPDDPIGAARGKFKHLAGPTADEVQAEERRAEAEIEESRYRR